MSLSALPGVEQLNTDWLSEAVGHTVSSFEVQDLAGEGYNSRLYRVRVRYTGNDVDAPPSYILKLMSDDPIGDAITNNNEVFREVASYQHLGDDLESVVPHAYVATDDKASGQLTLLLADLGEIPHKPFRADLTTSLEAVRAIAKIHAHFWEADILDLQVFEPNDLDLDEVIRTITESLAISKQREVLHPYLDECMQHVRAMAPRLLALMRNFDNRASTLIHGDFHCRNIHTVGDRLMIFDWQNSQRGSAVTDIAYWIMTSVEVEDRPQFEPKLLTAYHEALVAAGVDDYSEDQLNADYRNQASQMVTQIYCYLSLIDLPDDEIGDFLNRIDAVAQDIGFRRQLRVARVIVPVAAGIQRVFRMFRGGRRHQSS
ncbi:MAG: phosphotransferase [Pseudomonadota bacterium]